MLESIPMPFSGKDVPHIVIEVNQACNLACKACYKDRHGYTKPLDQICAEIDLAAERRNLDMLTLAGGEPTLHPQLAEVIAHATSRGIKTSLLTNGSLLDDERLSSYARAGLIRVALHVDTLQNRPDAPADAACEADLDPLRLAIFERVAAHGILCGQVATLYQSNLDDLPAMTDLAFRCRDVSLVLMTLCTDFRPIAEAHGQPGGPAFDEHERLEDEDVVCGDVERVLARSHGLAPLHHIPSDRREDEKRWLLYLGFAITDPDGSYHTLFLAPRFRRTVGLANEMQRWTKGRYKFDMVPGRFECVFVCLLYALLGLSWTNLVSVASFLRHLLRRGTRIHSKVLVFQKPPNLTPDGQIEACKDCPDATIRDGQLIPLCLADILSPLPSVPVPVPDSPPG
jgi:pyruvate-formate lyase-activating enzyme